MKKIFDAEIRPEEADQVAQSAIHDHYKTYQAERGLSIPRGPAMQMNFHKRIDELVEGRIRLRVFSTRHNFGNSIR